MVYTQICEWLHDFVDGAEPEELLDSWDCNQWINDSEIISIFKEYVLPSLKHTKSQNDAIQILLAVISEYFEFRRIEALSTREPSLVLLSPERICVLPDNKKYLTSGEFSNLLQNNNLRKQVFKSKIGKDAFDKGGQEKVYLTKNDNPNFVKWNIRFEPIIKQLYEKKTGNTITSKIDKLNHTKLTNLIISSEDNLYILNNGTLLKLNSLSKSLSSTASSYSSLQIGMEICSVQNADSFNCTFETGSFMSMSDFKDSHVGIIYVYGVRHLPLTWEYVYSPIFPDTVEGRADALRWRHADYKNDSSASSVSSESTSSDCLHCPNCSMTLNESTGNATFVPCLKCNNPGAIMLEQMAWRLDTFKLDTYLKNERWWTTVAEPEFKQFWKDVNSANLDPLFTRPDDIEIGPMFIDEDVLFKK